MEEKREEKIGNVIAWLQAGARGKQSRVKYKQLKDQKLALYACQRAIRGMVMAKTWPWMTIWLAIKPNLKCAQFTKYKKEYEEKIAEAEAHMTEATKAYDLVVAKHEKLLKERAEMQNILSQGGAAVQAIIDKTERMEEEKDDCQKEVNNTKNRIENEELEVASVQQSAEKVAKEADRLRGEIKNLENRCELGENDKKTKDEQIETLRDELTKGLEVVNKLQRER